MQELSMPLVVILGLATVFVVLICIILMIKLMSVIINSVKKEDDTPQPVPAGNVQTAVPTPAPANQSMVVAAMAAAIAEDMGTNVSQLRIHSIRKI